MGINYEPIENTCGCTQYAGERVIEFNDQLLCEACFLEEIQELIDSKAVETLADLVMSNYWRVE